MHVFLCTKGKALTDSYEKRRSIVSFLISIRRQSYQIIVLLSVHDKCMMFKLTESKNMSLYRLEYIKIKRYNMILSEYYVQG